MARIFFRGRAYRGLSSPTRPHFAAPLFSTARRARFLAFAAIESGPHLRTGRSIPLMQCSQHGEKCNEWFRTGPLRFEVTMGKVVPRQRRTLVTRNRYRLWKAELLLIPD
jgi:hypothetical protein